MGSLIHWGGCALSSPKLGPFGGGEPTVAVLRPADPVGLPVI